MSERGHQGRPVRAGRERPIAPAAAPRGPSSRRAILASLAPRDGTHAGLWLDKFIHGQSDSDVESRRNLVKATASIAEPPLYGLFYRRWKESLDAHGARTHQASVAGRMIVGVGAESVLEASVTLHRTYGVPYIPGSALKGLAAAYARRCLDAGAWGPQSDAYRTVFGATDASGYITFFDALYVPGSGCAARISGGTEPRALHADVLTVHHPDYYQGNSPSAPADWDSPTPIPFLSATGCYLVALAGPDVWVAATFDLLAHALDELGVGAKTASGYGRLTLDVPPYTPPADAASGDAGTPGAEPAASAPVAKGRGVIKIESRKQGRRNLDTPSVVDAADSSRHRFDWRDLHMDALKNGTHVEYEYTVGPDGRRTVVAVRKAPAQSPP